MIIQKSGLSPACINGLSCFPVTFSSTEENAMLNRQQVELIERANISSPLTLAKIDPTKACSTLIEIENMFDVAMTEYRIAFRIAANKDWAAAQRLESHIVKYLGNAIDLTGCSVGARILGWFGALALTPIYLIAKKIDNIFVAPKASAHRKHWKIGLDTLENERARRIDQLISTRATTLLRQIEKLNETNESSEKGTDELNQLAEAYEILLNKPLTIQQTQISNFIRLQLTNGEE